MGYETIVYAYVSAIPSRSALGEDGVPTSIQDTAAALLLLQRGERNRDRQPPLARRARDQSHKTDCAAYRRIDQGRRDSRLASLMTGSLAAIIAAIAHIGFTPR